MSGRPIAGVSTSTAAFVDVFAAGPIDQPVRVTSMAEFVRVFGGLDERSESSYGVSQFFLNGGRTGWIVRLDASDSTRATVSTGGVSFEARRSGSSGNRLAVAVVHRADGTISVWVRETEQHAGSPAVMRGEEFHQLTVVPGPRNVVDVINHQSALVGVTAVTAPGSGTEPTATDEDLAVVAPNAPAPEAFVPLSGGDDGTGSATDRVAARAAVAKLLSKEDDGTGMYALRGTTPERFDLLCLPATAFMDAADRAAILPRAAEFCEEQRAFLVVDGPIGVAPTEYLRSGPAELGNLSANAAVWYPALSIPDGLDGNRPRDVASSGTMAGVIARTDLQRGVWKAPAGTEAVLRGATPRFTIDDAESGAFNEQGINCLRTFPIQGSVSWGARTLRGADALASEWKYVPVRRTALFIENSVYAGTDWVVFEPNDEPLWAQLRLSIGAFLHDLFRQGAFPGASASEAFFVRCDGTTTSASDIARGIVNITVGFAPLSPAEFVIIEIALNART